MSVTIGHAAIDENGKAKGGAAGDQTGKEVCTRTWYAKGWNKLVRPKKSTVASKIITAMKQACDNNNVGYDQGQRTTLYTQAKAKDWDISKVSVACECDCSSLVAVCVNAAGVTVSKDIYTGNMVNALKNTGEFEVLTDSKYLTSDEYLVAGDILVKEGSHTAIALTNGSKASTESTTTAVSSSTPSYTVGQTYTTQVDLNVRKGAGTNYGKKKVSELTADGQKHAYTSGGYAVMRSGTRITCKAVKKSGNNIWVQTPSGWLAAYYSGKTYIK